MLTKRSRATVSACSVLLLATAFPTSGNAQENQAHAHAAAAVTQLQLNTGKRWTTDAPLRSGMAAIRDAFDAEHPAIHADKETDAQYDALATRIEKEVQSIVASCKLPADADANLHFIVADLLQGVDLMRGGDDTKSRHDGAALVHGALNAYPRFFDDPAWHQLQPVH